MDNLLDVVDHAEQCKSPFWSWDSDTRSLFGRYVEEKKKRENVPESIPEEEPEMPLQDPSLEEVITEHDESETKTDDPPAPPSEVKETPQQKGRQKSAKWLEYVGYAREHLKKENGGQKVENATVYALAREWLKDDNWI